MDQAALAAAALSPVTQPFTILVTVKPAVTVMALSSQNYVGGPVNNGGMVGHIMISTNPPGQVFTGTLSLGGTDAAKFALSSPTMPSDLLIGAADLLGANYNITITATP